MIQVPPGLIGWSWVFVTAYVGLMIFLGTRGQHRISTGEDFAVARGGYGPFTLAIAFAATIARVSVAAISQAGPVLGRGLNIRISAPVGAETIAVPFEFAARLWSSWPDSAWHPETREICLTQ